MSDRELDVLARTLWGEARGEGAVGMVAGAVSVPAGHPYKNTLL